MFIGPVEAVMFVGPAEAVEFLRLGVDVKAVRPATFISMV